MCYRRPKRQLLRGLRALWKHKGDVLAPVFCALIIDFVSFSWSAIRGRSTLNSHEAYLQSTIGKVFIVSIQRNSASILESHWKKALVNLVKALGPQNAAVCIYESDSWDRTKELLQDLDQLLGELKVNRTVLTSDRTHADDIAEPRHEEGWIKTPKGEEELRRIPWLAGIRNKSLEPLRSLLASGARFDKILFLDDFAFTSQDILSLLQTRGGNYAAACSLDFKEPPKFYDTFAFRDSDGNQAALSTYPYFRTRLSRFAMISGMPIPVKSCWNGAVAFDATPFMNHESPLRFRGLNDSLAKYHLEASECCLVHYDNPLSRKHGVWMNPAVRVGHNADAYEVVANGSSWPPTGEVFWDGSRALGSGSAYLGVILRSTSDILDGDVKIQEMKKLGWIA